MNLEIKKTGNSTGLILPKELLARLRLQKGNQVTVTERSRSHSTITPLYDHETMRIAREVMKKYAATFRALAK